MWLTRLRRQQGARGYLKVVVYRQGGCAGNVTRGPDPGRNHGGPHDGHTYAVCHASTGVQQAVQRPYECSKDTAARPLHEANQASLVSAPTVHCIGLSEGGEHACSHWEPGQGHLGRGKAKQELLVYMQGSSVTLYYVALLREDCNCAALTMQAFRACFYSSCRHGCMHPISMQAGRRVPGRLGNQAGKAPNHCAENARLSCAILQQLSPPALRSL